MNKAFRIHPDDNVAVLLGDCFGGIVEILGASAGMRMDAHGEIKTGHKIALATFSAGDPVVKYGLRIGHATRCIAPGDWVHLHNCASDCDERSNTLDIATGAPTDTPYD
jgi:hypothetical protein